MTNAELRERHQQQLKEHTRLKMNNQYMRERIILRDQIEQWDQAIKQLQKEFDDLKKRLDALEAKQ